MTRTPSRVSGSILGAVNAIPEDLPAVFSRHCNPLTMCIILLSSMLFFLRLDCAHAWAAQIFKVADFSASQPGGPLPAGWQALVFPKIKRHTRYTLVKDDGTTVIRAVSRRSASALVRNVRVDPRVYPILTWRWKISGVNTRGDVHRKNGDDYAARIFIIFSGSDSKTGIPGEAGTRVLRSIYGEALTAKYLNYIWANKAPVGTVVASPYTGRFMMIAVESGNQHAGTWVTERRNLFSDYKKAFGKPSPPVAAVAIMTDTDDTGQSAVAYFGDIAFVR